jgi:site-specific DNA-methyltransferase (adenine-specific)
MKLTTKDIRVVENPEFRMLNNRVGLFNSSFQDFKRYGIPKAQLILTDIPYSLGDKAYGSNPSWYIGGDNKNGESDKAGESFFVTDENFKPAEFMHFASQMLKPEPKEREGRTKSSSPCMIVFCEFMQQFYLIELAKKYGFKHYINLVFRKNYSAQVLKANMRVVGNCEYGLILYRDKLPKFNNNGQMIFNCMDWNRDLGMKRTHETQKPIPLLKRLIELFTDPDDVVIDPCAGSGSTLVSAASLGRKAYGMEVSKRFYIDACNNLETYIQPDMFSIMQSKYYARKDMLQNAKNEQRQLSLF